MRRWETVVWSLILVAPLATAAAEASSSIVLPIEFDLSGFVSDAERELPRRMQSGWEAVGKTVKMPVAYRYELERDPIEIEGRGDRLVISTKVRYKVDVAVPGPSTQTGLAWRRVNGCQPKKTVTVSLETRIDFAPDWKLSARSQPKLEMPEPCRLSAARELVQVDISQKVRLAFADGLNKAAKDFDRRVAAQVSLRDLAEKAWSGLAAPVPMGGSVWLALHPERVLVMRPVVVGRMLRTGVVVDGRPAVVTDAAEPATEQRALPPLELTGSREGFQLDWTAAVSWTEAITQLRQAVVGQQIKVAGRRTVRIEGVDLRPQGDRVLVVADLSGGVKGRIQLTGRPRFEASSRMLEFADLEFTLETNSFLVRVADWFRHEGTRQQLAKLTKVDVVKSLDQNRSRLVAALQERFGGDVQLDGALTAVEPFELQFDATEIRVNARLTGSLVLRWGAGRQFIRAGD